MAVYNPRLDIARAAREQATSASVQTLKSVLNKQNTSANLRKDYTSGAGAQGPPSHMFYSAEATVCVAHLLLP